MFLKTTEERDVFWVFSKWVGVINYMSTFLSPKFYAFFPMSKEFLVSQFSLVETNLASVLQSTKHRVRT